ncbi:MAG: HAD family hydrolase [Desulfobacterales bacterium]|nr:HAD family hydrolase [Desulfobacterales bacterium]
MIEAVLLDLDNTMVLFDETTYVEEYFERLFPWFSDLFSPEELTERVMTATGGLRENSGRVSNREFFLDRFDADGTAGRSRVWERFMGFYEEDYPGIRVKASAPAGLQNVLFSLARSRLKLVLASNPVFPLIAQETRMGWAGIAPSHFDLFTHIENMSFVKPNLGYYRQICDMLRVPPASCLMVGNDPVADMEARRAGLKTYLSTDAADAGYATLSLTAAARKKDTAPADADFVGPFSEVPTAVEKLGGSISEAPSQGSASENRVRNAAASS